MKAENAAVMVGEIGSYCPKVRESPNGMLYNPSVALHKLGYRISIESNELSACLLEDLLLY
ncbi:hypothetical protein T265_12362 [Opisthorchis viverrini]|uniref:Uncharacterized protein n=1 Tax=Opisthorchis viverrini TaxID=6198 RepID=A0A074Z4C3_OPIVI|nr:hypothetical protein T265_12362 [Opisthorchis viverrini]KER18135.1 hypothetical protein T265_12362 [Opisthorchis viverrini]